MAGWPEQVVDYHDHHMDSTVWRDFQHRDGDIVVASYGKNGTTLTQQLIGQLISLGDPDFKSQDVSPWLDLRIVPRADMLGQLEAQTHRRFIKTHLPTTALPYQPTMKYIYLARDGRDVAYSWYNHHGQMQPSMISKLQDPVGLVGPPFPDFDPSVPPRSYFLRFLRQDGHPWWPLFSNVRSWWSARQLPNVLLVHFNSLRSDLAGESRRIADFLGIAVPEDRWPSILHHCSMDFMREHQQAPGGGAFFKDGAAGFVFKGINGRWKDDLTAEDCAEYEARAVKELGEECAAWLATGELAGAKEA